MRPISPRRSAMRCKTVGVPASAIRFDDANKRIPLPTETGNLIVDLPGTRPGPRLLFSTHLDTVPLCAGAKPRREGDRIVSDGTTALGGDARTGVALLVVLAETLIKHKLPHPPITLLFTVREESGLHGARELNPADLGGAVMCINVDGQLASELIIGAVGQENWEVEIKGRASHAGVAPEKGISATHGRRHRPCRGAAGRLVRQGGEARRPRHQQCRHFRRQGRQAGRRRDQCRHRLRLLKGEARSPEAAFATKIADGYKEAFAKAQGAVKDHEGDTAEVTFSHTAGLSALRTGRGHAGRPARRQGAQDARHRADLPVLQRRSRRQLARQARHPDDHHRRRPGRNPHDQGICEPRRVREGMPSRHPDGDAGGLAVHASAGVCIWLRFCRR